MPFLKLNNDWSKLAQYYNQSFNNKPEVPTLKYTAFDDGLIRGGVLNATLASVRDTARVGKFLASGKGVLFITKQVGLQLSNPQLEQEAPKDTFGKLGTKSDLLNKAAGVINTATSAINDFIKQRSPNQIYNLGLNTLTQIPLNAFGGHIIRQGILPIGGGGYLNNSTDNIKGYNYEKIVKNNNEETGSPNNRLVKYLKLSSKTPYGVLELNKYNGGANSSYGVGETRITTNDVRSTDLSNKLLVNNVVRQFFGLNSTFNPLTAEQILNTPQAKLDDSLSTQLLNSPLISNKNIANRPSGSIDIERRVGVSRPGPGPLRSVDAINTISVMDSKTFYGKSQTGTLNNSLPAASNLFTYTSGSTEKVQSGYFGRDIIKFRIEFLNNDTNVPTVLAFRAYIDDFSDGMQARWNSYRYMGRGEDFYVYDGFTRDMSVAFTIHAHSPAEMAPLYQKLNYLMSAFAPDYNTANKMRGNIGYLTVGDYIYRQPGVFTDIKLSGMLDTHWEIAFDAPEEGEYKNQYEVPKHIKVNLSFKPIHNFLPRRAKASTLDKSPFITPNDATNKYLKSII